MVRTRSGAAATVALAALLAGCTGPPSDHDEGAVLRLGDSFPLNHPIHVGGVQPFMEELEAQGMSVEYFANDQLGKQHDMASLLRSDVVQLGPVSPAYVGTELPMSNVGDLPGMVDDPCVGGDAVLAAMQEGGTLFEEELSPRGLRPLWVALVPGYEAMTTAEPMVVPEDGNGRILRSTGGVLDRVVDEVGAAGVAMPLGDMYEAVSRGTVAGTFASPVSVAPYRLGEVLDHTTDGARLGSFTVTFAVSEETWDRLAPEQRDVLTGAADSVQRSVCEAIRAEREESLTLMAEQGVEVHELDAEGRTAWEGLYEPVRRTWVSDLESVGLPASQVLEEFETALEHAREQDGEDLA